MEDVERVCENIVLLHKGKLAAQGKIEDLKAIDKEVEIHVWGHATKMEEGLLGEGMKVRREGRVMRVRYQNESTYHTIFQRQQNVELKFERCTITKHLLKIYFS